MDGNGRLSGKYSMQHPDTKCVKLSFSIYQPSQSIMDQKLSLLRCHMGERGEMDTWVGRQSSAKPSRGSSLRFQQLFCKVRSDTLALSLTDNQILIDRNGIVNEKGLAEHILEVATVQVAKSSRLTVRTNL